MLVSVRVRACSNTTEVSERFLHMYVAKCFLRRLRAEAMFIHTVTNQQRKADSPNVETHTNTLTREFPPPEWAKRFPSSDAGVCRFSVCIRMRPEPNQFNNRLPQRNGDLNEFALLRTRCWTPTSMRANGIPSTGRVREATMRGLSAQTHTHMRL